jgi:PKD repeat protein
MPRFERRRRKMKKISALALALIITTAILTQWNQKSEPIGASSVQAITVAPRLYVDPPMIDDPALGIGTEFTVNINIENVENLYGWQVNMTYNPEVLFTSEALITEGSLLADTFSSTIFVSKVSNATGYMQFACSAFPPYPEIGAYGDGTLASVAFYVIAEESGTPLHFVEGTALRTVVGDTVVPIEDFVTEDGYFDNHTTSIPPIAAFWVATPTPEVSKTVAFDASASRDPDGWLNSYHWDYGDNQSQVFIRGVNLTTVATHVYAHEGFYQVTLTVTDNEGLTDWTSAPVNVTVHVVISHVAVLNSWDRPSYFTGGLGNDYQILVDALNSRGFDAQAVTNEQIISGILGEFEVFVMVDNVPNVAAVPYVVDFWSNGGGVVAFDSSICFLNYAGILPPESAGSNGNYVYWDYGTYYQTRISAAHPITVGYEVGQIIPGTGGDAQYFVDALAGTSAYPYYTMLAEDIWTPERAYVSAYEPPSSGNVAHIWDDHHWRNLNLQLMILNAMEWASASRYEHDLAVSLSVPSLLRLDYPTMLNATVRNRGLNNETNVELDILINDEIVDSVLVPALLTDWSYTLSYEWTPTIEGIHRITARAVPVPEEVYTANNEQTTTALVMRPLIEPMEGQWADYNISSPYASMLLNTTYTHYISPTQMNVSICVRDNLGHNATIWMIVNVMTRQVEAGVWAGSWYFFWIQPDVEIGSMVNIIDRLGMVTESRYIEVEDGMVDCWGLHTENFGMHYTFWFDKVNGLVVAADGEGSYNGTETWRLTSTNVPLVYLPRFRIQLTPENGSVGTETLIAGVNATQNGSVEIYWDSTYVGVATADENGNFEYTLAIPPSTRGAHTITAVDITTDMEDTKTFTVLSTISATPISGPMGTKVQVTGLGFGPNEQAILTFEDMIIAVITTDNSGSFTATFTIPLALNGQYQIKARYWNDYATATFTVTETSKLDIIVDAGAIYFKGETAEFYIQTAFNGKPIDITAMNAQLYLPDGTTATLTYSRIATGLCKITYLLNGKGSKTGTYTIVIEANYTADTIAAFGTTIKTFLVKSTWEKETPKIAALSLASIGLISAMLIIWRKARKDYL